MDAVQVKREVTELLHIPEPDRRPEPSTHTPVIDLGSSSDSDTDSSSSLSSDDDGRSVLGTDGKRTRFSSDEGLFKKTKKRKKLKDLVVALPLGFLDPLPLKNAPLPLPPPQSAALKSKSAAIVNGNAKTVEIRGNSKQFWKAGDYVDENGGDWDTPSGGMDHVRVHPKFLHSNATSHKWVLGAFAELLDNSLDEVCYGATFVNVDMLTNEKDGSRMLLIEDNGGGMDPDKLRQCMSLGYSVKSKIADTIGQYGNGFKTSTMRLGADVIVFSRCGGQDGKRPTQSIGLLSYTFLRSTGKEDIVVPMLDYEGGGREWNRMRRSSASDWKRNVDTMLQWSPFSSEAELLRQFSQMKGHGTRVIIYNLWEDDQGQLELDFDADPYDIQIRGVNRDEKKILMGKQFPNSKHFLTYRHSLRSYASILYLRIPPRFRIILRGKDVVQHNIVNDMMMTQEVVYRPQHVTDGVPKDSHMVAVVTIGFVKDAKSHIDVQGFNVYHKNRLIKPFWRIWNAAGSDGRGVIGVLEADFVEPAHDKQGFERTTVLSRLETKLLQMQKTYWRGHAHKIGYAPRCDIKHRETSPDYLPQTPSQSFKKNAGSSSKIPVSVSDKLHSHTNQKQGGRSPGSYLKTADKSLANGHVYTKVGKGTKTHTKLGKVPRSLEPSSPSDEDASDNEMHASPERRANRDSHKENDVHEHNFSPPNSNSHTLDLLKEENRQLTERLKRKEEVILGDLQRDFLFEEERRKSLETKLEEATRKIEEMNKEQENLIDIFSEERERRDVEEENLRNKLKEASNTIKELIDKVRQLEKMKKTPSSKFDDYSTLEIDF